MPPNRQSAAAAAHAWALRADELTEAALAERTAAAITAGNPHSLLQHELHLNVATDLLERADEARDMVAVWATVAPLLEEELCGDLSPVILSLGHDQPLICQLAAGHPPYHRDSTGRMWWQIPPTDPASGQTP